MHGADLLRPPWLGFSRRRDNSLPTSGDAPHFPGDASGVTNPASAAPTFATPSSGTCSTTVWPCTAHVAPLARLFATAAPSACSTGEAFGPFFPLSNAMAARSSCTVGTPRPGGANADSSTSDRNPAIRSR